MDINEIPQDDSKIFRGQKKVIYATQNGHYKTGTTTGWDTEAFVTEQAVEEFNQLTNEALDAVKRGENHRSFIICTVIVSIFKRSLKPQGFGSGKLSDILNRASLINSRIMY